MKKIILLAAVLLAPVMLCAEEKDAITDIQEERSFASGEYKVSDEGDTINVKKGEGFDFKVPEILITGQVDTKIMLKREITSLENLQDVKNVLYEKEKIEMPYSYLKEEEFTPQFAGAQGQKDFTGRVLLEGGTYSSFGAEALAAAALGSVGDMVIRGYHENFSNQRVNSRDTYSNLNGVDFYFRTEHHPFEAVYSFSGFLNGHSNPFPSNSLGGYFDHSGAALKGSAAGAIEGFDLKGIVSYGYSAKKSGEHFTYKENTLSLSASGEKDYMLEDDKRIKAMLSADFRGFDRVYPGGADRGGFELGALIKAILFLEPVNMQAGLKLSGYAAGADYFWMSPYLRASFVPVSWLSFYIDFTPDMSGPDYAGFISSPYLLPSSGVKPAAENMDFRGGAYLNAAGIFTEVFWGAKGIKNNLYIDDVDSDGIFEYRNNDIEYTYAGLSAETMKIKDLSVMVSYTYRHAYRVSNNKLTYFPHNTAGIKAVYDLFEWKFTGNLKIESAFMGTSSEKIPAFALLDILIEREIAGGFTAGLEINNILNNEHYLLYYYKLKGINGTLSLSYKF